MTHPKGYVDTAYLQAVGEFVQHVKQRSYAMLHLEPGHHVLDVGCGPGTDTIPLTALVGPTGQVMGVDYDSAMITEADQRAAHAGVRSGVRHQQADAAALPFASGEFDACRSERLFQHLLQPEQVLGEMVRVTKPGGWVVVVDTDWGTLSLDTPEVEIERRLVRVLAERTVNNGYAGRQLYRLFKHHHLADIAIELFPLVSTSYAFTRTAILLDAVEQDALAAGVITQEELQRWRISLEVADGAGVYFASVSQVMVAGRKPA